MILRTVLESTPKLYAEYKYALRYREEAECWRDAYAKLRSQNLLAMDGDIIGQSWLQPGEANRLCADVTRSSGDLDIARSDVATLRGAATALRRDLNSAQQTREEEIAVAAERD